MKKTCTGTFPNYSMIVEGIVSARVMKYERRNSEEEEELHVAKRGKKRDCPFGVEMRSFLGV